MGRGWFLKALRTQWMIFPRIPTLLSLSELLPKYPLQGPTQDPEQGKQRLWAGRMEAGTGESGSPAGQEALFLLPTPPGKLYRDCPSTFRTHPLYLGHLGTCAGFRGFKLQLDVGAAREGRHSRVELGTCHPISVVHTSAEQLPCSPCRPPAGRSRAWPGGPACPGR